MKASGIRGCFIHLEFFVLPAHQEGPGKTGDVLGLELNMVPSRGSSTEMFNYANETSLYKIRADMVAFHCSTLPTDRTHHYSAFCGRRSGKHFILDHAAVMAKYGHCMKVHVPVPDALSGAMGNHLYLAIFDSKEEMDRYYRNLTAFHETYLTRGCLTFLSEAAPRLPETA